MHRTLIACVVVLAGCSGATSTVGNIGVATATLRGQGELVRVSVEVADSPEERERGLMDRTSLEADAGMVFIVADDDGAVPHRFWMKDTQIPLSIAFWDADGSILAIRDMDPCTAEPCPRYGPPTPYIGALEVNQGFFEEHGIHVGDSIELS
jgi:uncharacterized membrane protein (UPF0127 family)